MLLSVSDLKEIKDNLNRYYSRIKNDYSNVKLDYLNIVDNNSIVVIVKNSWNQYVSMVVENYKNRFSKKETNSASITIYDKKLDINNLEKSKEDVNTLITSTGFYHKSDRIPFEDLELLFKISNKDRSEEDDSYSEYSENLKMNKAKQVLSLFFIDEKMQNELPPKIELPILGQLYDKIASADYPQGFDKTFTVKDIKGNMTEELMFVVIDKETGKPKSSKLLKIVGVTKKAIGLSDPTQSDQLRAYIPKVQMLIRGAYKDKDKTVVISESPAWILKNIAGKGIKV